jgi:hypothetical protein
MAITSEKRLLQLAAKQFGIACARDLIACQVSEKWLRRRLATGEWVRIHPGVFKLGAIAPGLDQLEIAAMLAAGNGAVLSHISAARRLGLDVPRERSVQLTIPVLRDRPNLVGVRIWRSRHLPEKDLTQRGPFRLTNLARTMIDLGSVLDRAWLRAALDSAIRQRRTNLGWIARALRENGKGRRGAKHLGALVAGYQRENEVPDSALESLAMELASATGRKPKLHWTIVEDGCLIAEVDCGWPEVRLCVEVDGWMHHSTRAAFTGDRARDRALLGLGWMVLRYTWQDVTGDRESVIAELAKVYDSRALSAESLKTRPPRSSAKAAGQSELEVGAAPNVLAPRPASKVKGELAGC